MVQDRDIAADLLQESFVNIFKNIQSYSPTYSFYTWSKRITINNCINYLNKKRIDFQYTDDVGEHAEESVANDDDELMMHQIESINKAMLKLPNGYREIFSLYLIEGYDHSEIAEIMNISESTSKSQFSRAKVKLKQIIKETTHGQQSI